MPIEVANVYLSCGCDKLVDKRIAKHLKVGSKSQCHRHGEVTVISVVGA